MTNASQAYLIPGRIPDGLLNNALFVDGSTLVPDAEQTGSILNPYRTITQALDTITSATTAEEARNVNLVIIAPGDYDEDLAIDITGKRIQLLSWGPWGLGTFESTDWAPSGTRRNITISGSGANIDGIRPAFGIGTFEQIGERASTHQSYFTGARISGQVLVTATGGGSIEIDLEAEVFGTTGTSAGVSFDATLNNPIIQLYLYNGRYRGQVQGGTNCQFQHAEKVRFNGRVVCNAYSLIDRCRLDDGFTCTSAAPAGLVPQGFMNSVFTAGTFSGPAGSMRVDSFTDYWIQTNNINLVGGATRLLYDPQGMLFIRNETGATLTPGQLVYVSGFDDPTDLPLATLARADMEATARAIGMVMFSIPNNSNGWVVKSGIVTGLNTAAFTDGDPIWLSATVAGAITTTQPVSPNFSTFIGYILDAAGGTGGSVLVEIASSHRETGIGYEFGADMAAVGNQGNYFTAHGDSSAAPVVALNSDSEIVVPTGGRAAFISWNSVSANPGPPPPSRTTWKVLRNGLVIDTIQVTGVRGFAALPSNTVFAQGDRLAVEYDAGDAPGRTIIEVVFL